MNDYSVSHDIMTINKLGRARTSKVRYYGSVSGNILLEDMCKSLTRDDNSFEGIKVFYLINNTVRISMYNHLCIGAMVTIYMSYGDYKKLESEIAMRLDYYYRRRASLSNMSATASIVADNIYVED